VGRTHHPLADVVDRARDVGGGPDLGGHHRGVLGAEVHGRAEEVVLQAALDAVGGLQMVLHGLRPMDGYGIGSGRIFGLDPGVGVRLEHWFQQVCRRGLAGAWFLALAIDHVGGVEAADAAAPGCGTLGVGLWHGHRFTRLLLLLLRPLCL